MIGAPATAAAKTSVWVARNAVSNPPHEWPTTPTLRGSATPIATTFFTAGSDALDDRQARLARAEDDVGLENEVARARERGRVVVVALGRRDEAVHAVRQPLVHVDDHRILLPGS